MKLSKQIIREAAQKFNLKEKDFTTLSVDDKTAVVYKGIMEYKGSWDNIMSGKLKDWSVKVAGETYDLRTGMTWAVYAALQDSLTEKVDKNTWTLLTGEPIAEWQRHYWTSEVFVPTGRFLGGQVKSSLLRSDYTDSRARPRLAVIIDDLELDTSFSSSELPDALTIDGVVYRREE